MTTTRPQARIRGSIRAHNLKRKLAVYMHAANSRALGLQEVYMQAETNVGQRQCRRKVQDGNKLLRN